MEWIDFFYRIFYNTDILRVSRGVEVITIDKQCTFFFPSKLISGMSGINFVNNIFRMVNSNEYSCIIFDFNVTNTMETNLLAVLAYLLEKIYSNKIEFILKLNNKIYKNHSQIEIQNQIFDFFSDDKSPALMPRKLGNRNSKKVLLPDIMTIKTGRSFFQL